MHEKKWKILNCFHLTFYHDKLTIVKLLKYSNRKLIGLVGMIK
jgi:hypothetical protein